MVGRNANGGFGLGRYTTMKQVTTSTSTNKVPKTHVIMISGDLYQRFRDFASHNFNTDPYETILSDLLDFYEKHNKDRWYHNTS